MTRALVVLRWVLLVPAAVAAWYAALVAGMLALELHMRLCPRNYQVSGLCRDLPVLLGERAIIVVFAGLSAAFVVIAAVAMAPAARPRIAWLTWLAGTLAALTMLHLAEYEALAECFAAVLVGGVAAAIAQRVTGDDRLR